MGSIQERDFLVVSSGIDRSTDRPNLVSIIIVIIISTTTITIITIEVIWYYCIDQRLHPKCSCCGPSRGIISDLAGLGSLERILNAWHQFKYSSCAVDRHSNDGISSMLCLDHRRDKCRHGAAERKLPTIFQKSIASVSILPMRNA